MSTDRSHSKRLLAGVTLAVVLMLVPAAGAAAQIPTSEGVMVALRDVSISLDGIRVRSAVVTDGGSSALVQLVDGTLVDIQLVEVAAGWSVRDFSLVAGDADSFRAWTSPWRERVAAAENFIAGMSDSGDRPTRRPEELAPLFWFEDPDESSRLWGMNPVTYRMMQALRVMPSGPMTGGPPTNPVPRRNQ